MSQQASQPLRSRVELFLEPASKTNKLPDTAALVNVLEKFSEGHAAVVIVDSQERPVGIFTPSDMTRIRQAFLQDRKTPAKDLMSAPVEWVELSDTIEHALDLMQSKGIHTGIAVVTDRRSQKYAGYLYRSSMAKMLSAMLGPKAF
ncbi:MAG: CBS domain-containing protein [Chloroflexi bacterium]|nr:CBS domain-containing protein [Chloroflexota bacterium]